MKLYPASVELLQKLPQAFEKNKRVANMTLDERERTARLMFTGPCRDYPALERAFGAAGVPALVTNHTRVAVRLVAGKNADLEKAKSELGSVDGVLTIRIQSGVAEMCANIGLLDLGEISRRAKEAGFSAEAMTHERVEVSFQGASADVVRDALDRMPGVIVARDGGQGAILLTTVLRISEDSIRKTLGKAGASLVKATRG